MPDKKMIIFDFDGTIADTFDESYNIYNEIASRYKCKQITLKEREILRNKKPQEFLKKYGVTRIKLPLLLMNGRRRMHRNIKKIQPIKGMVEAIKSIKKIGFKMGILTSNSKKNVKIFLKNAGLSEEFEFIRSGKHLFGKSRSIRAILKRKRIPKKSVILIGDETRDVEAAKKTGISIIAVSWGYNSKEILKELLPEKLVSLPSDLYEYLKKAYENK